MIMTKRDGEDFDGIGRLPNESHPADQCPRCQHPEHGTARCDVASRMQDGGFCSCRGQLPGFDPIGMPPARPANPSEWSPAERATAIIDYLPDGPSLLYVHLDGGTADTRTFTQVDAIAVRPKRSQRDTKIERAVCRALLMHALQLLDEAEAGDDE
jgi:hypothetical protein